MIDRRFASRLEGAPLYQWLGVAAAPVFFGTIVTIAAPTLGGVAAGLLLIGVGAAFVVVTLRVVAREELGQLTVRNHLRSATFPLASIRSIGASQVLVLRTLRSYGRLVITDGDGRRWPLVGTTGESPELIRVLVRDLAEAAPDADVDVDLSWFPHDRSRRRGEGHLGTSAAPPSVARRTLDPDEQQRRRREEGQVEADRLRAELDRIRAGNRT